MKRPDTVATSILAIFFAVGIVGHALVQTLPLMILLTPFVLFVAGGVVFWWEARHQGRAFLIWAAVTYVVTFALEVIGARTGLVFGAYSYGSTLGVKVLDVPLVIGFNWTIVVLGCVTFTTSVIRHRLFAVVVAAALAVLFDIFLEPVAIRLDYWTWAGGDIPLQNYIAWFVISLAAGLAYSSIPLERKTWLPAVYAVIQAVFFIALRLTAAT